MKEVTLGTLRARVCGGTDREGGGAGPIVVLLHGFGAPGTDLVPLWRELSVPQAVRFVFPEAPHDLGNGGRAWWHIDMVRLQDRFQAGAAQALIEEVPEGIAEARTDVLGLLDALQRDWSADPETTVLGGFSQGAMLATDLILRTEQPFAGLVILSGSLVGHAEWLKLMPARAGLPVVQSHGRADPMLPFAIAEQLRTELSGAGLDVKFIPFNGGHTIPNSALSAVGELISRVALKPAR